ncbi:STAS domain-containing protein [Dactylosporangium sp. NBC_01737]|uniref:STAS domain-containing protein n=1 Tax=Dactylosporangium sp. NBC_01737 TaxID=2975959 RepID=UPI002E15C098|nr:STAS domain-containing protein [Dactylosporangium sp. NBC_01737]
MNAVVLALHGLLVEGTVETVEPVLAGCLVAAEPRLVLDVSQVTVCDTAGAALLVRVAELAWQRGGELRLAAPSPAIRSWAQVAAGMDGIAAFASVEGAVEADPRDLILAGPAMSAACIDEPAYPARRRPRWRVNPSARGRSRRGPASPRR